VCLFTSITLSFKDLREKKRPSLHSPYQPHKHTVRTTAEWLSGLVGLQPRKQAKTGGMGTTPIV